MSWKKIAYLDEVAVLTSNTPTVIAPSDTGAAGSGTTAARDDHQHETPATWVPASHLLGAHSEDSLANLNAKITGVTLDDLGDPRDPNAHATSHKSAGGDAVLLHELGDPTGAIEINKQSLLNPVIDPQATAPATPSDGQIYYDTADDHLYCYVA